MSLGALAVIALWVALIISALSRPWVGATGYAFFVVLCPQWNWRWALPDLDYQKFLAVSTLLGFLMSGLRPQQLTKAGRYACFGLVGYLLLCYISSPQSINPGKTASYLDISWKIVLMVLLLIFTLRTTRQLTWFIAAMVVAQGWNAFNVNELYYQSGVNVRYFSWNFLDNNTYSISTVPIMAMSFAVMVAARKRWMVIVAGVAFLLQMHQLMILESRGTMIGALFLCALGFYFMPRTQQSLGLAAAGVVAGGILAGPSVVEEFTSSFESSDQLDSSAESRFELWRAGGRITADYPLLGVGPWAGEVYVPRYYHGRLDRDRKALHNLFFEVATGAGLPAAAMYLAFFFLPWMEHYRIWRRERNGFPEWFTVANLATLAGIPGYWVASMFSSGALIEPPYLLVGGAISSMAIYRYAGLPVEVVQPTESTVTPSLEFRRRFEMNVNT